MLQWQLKCIKQYKTVGLSRQFTLAKIAYSIEKTAFGIRIILNLQEYTYGDISKLHSCESP